MEKTLKEKRDKNIQMFDHHISYKSVHLMLRYFLISHPSMLLMWIHEHHLILASCHCLPSSYVCRHRHKTMRTSKKQLDSAWVKLCLRAGGGARSFYYYNQVLSVKANQTIVNPTHPKPKHQRFDRCFLISVDFAREHAAETGRL